MLIPVLLTIFSLFICSIFSGYAYALRKLGRLHSEQEFSRLPLLFFFQNFFKTFFKEKKWDGLYFSLSLGKHVLRICYAIAGFYLLLSYNLFSEKITLVNGSTLSMPWVEWVSILVSVLLLSFVIELVMIFAALIYPIRYIRIFSGVISCFLIVLAPLSALFLKISEFFSRNKEEHSLSALQMKNKILEILHESEISAELDQHEQKLILSMAVFKERMAREIMVPRIDILSLPSDTTIQTAAEKFISEGYSRIPVYRDTLDQIIGVVLYKDILSIYGSSTTYDELQKNLKNPIETIMKPVLYTPETKKISHLLQEFRNKQIHLAIVVDEYGSTEGIVTIEDILEELVGEIADEHDIGEATLYSSLPSGGYVVDAKMSIIDIEKELEIFIPRHPDYDTIGGYVFHCAGAIPKKGWKLHHDDFDLEILNSNDRSIKKIRISRNSPEFN